MRQAEFTIRINELLRHFVEEKLQPFADEMAEQGVIPVVNMECGVMFASPEAAAEFLKEEEVLPPAPLGMSDEQFLAAVGVQSDGPG